MASGFIAGGALVGVLAALLRFIEDSTQTVIVPDFTQAGAFGVWLAAWGHWVGLVAFVALAV